MRIVLNGEEIEIHDGATLDALVRDRGLADAACATEVNRRLVPKADRVDARLRVDDRVEIVTLVGGG